MGDARVGATGTVGWRCPPAAPLVCSSDTGGVGQAGEDSGPMDWVPEETDQKTGWCHRGHPGQKVMINFKKIILVLDWGPVLRNWTQGKKKNVHFMITDVTGQRSRNRSK